MAKTTMKISPVMVLAGDDVFERNRYLAMIKQQVLGDGDPGMALVRFVENVPVAEVLDEARMPSMFAPKKLVVVDPADGLLKNNEDELSGRRGALTNREVLENYLESPSDSAVLVLCCNSWLKSTRLHKSLDKLGAVLWCEPVKLGMVVGWLSRQAMDVYGKSIEPAAAEKLRDLIGPELQRLDNELAKLSLYQPDNPAITLAAVNALVGFQHEQEIWDLINALAERDAAKALRKIEELWQIDPKIEYTATGAVFSWLHQVLRARELVDRRLDDRTIGQNLKLWPPERAAKVLSLARTWGLAGATRWSRALLDVDLANKTSVGDPRSNLEKFIVELCSAETLAAV
jgi:DNA polymerase-3 subunit delta